ncbi:Inner membrane protein YqaA [Legionella birminghamensis]|uniref:inner membrane protein YqaA n=1 Tax=Legionella birminghamensis TaxID=28083 RepID=A0A378IAB2_9GAMM|nr:YqaA family protein [Legionella birminghamensis]KTC74708.1 Inner membrane protein YqaA [Legionella birminghamensis]STX31511.1 Inner membrane protein yqaA [Legionella birminghamensis]
MKIFTHLYDKMVRWSGHAHAPYYLAGVSFAESSFFPIPPDVMLISMGLANPRRSWQYALITTLFSVLGGVFGYLIGYFFIEAILPWIESSSWSSNFHQIQQWFTLHGILVIFIAGFSPIPYKLFTIAAGAMSMALLPFIFASALGRGLRFFLVSTIMYFFGDKLHNNLRQYVDIIGWSVLVVLILTLLIMKLLS